MAMGAAILSCSYIYIYKGSNNCACAKTLVLLPAYPKRQIQFPNSKRRLFSLHYRVIISPKQLTMARFAVFGDSRVKYLNDYLQARKPALVEAEVYNIDGGRIRAVISEAIAYLKHHPYDVIIFIAGICDMTIFNSQTHRYRVIHQTEGELVDHVVGLLNEADINLHRMRPHATIIFAQIVGEDLNRYAYAENVTPETQAMFDRAVNQINLEIVGINRRNWVKTPWLARQIHRYRGGNEYDSYYNLLSDGLHPTNGTLRYWAQSLSSLMHRCS